MKKAKRKPPKKKKPQQRGSVSQETRITSLLAENRVLWRNYTSVREDLAALTSNFDTLVLTVTAMRDELKHLQAALAQRGVWQHDYSNEKA